MSKCTLRELLEELMMGLSAALRPSLTAPGWPDTTPACSKPEGAIP